MISKDTGNIISSPGSADGATRSGSPDGRTTDPFGLAHARASRSAPRENEKEPPMPATSGLISTTSSASAVLQRSLGSRLRARMAAYGSPEYALTWKDWDMASGPPICALRASGHRTSGSGFTGWPMPLANDELGSTHCYGPKVEGKERARFLKLPGAALTAGWRTPIARPNGVGGRNINPETARRKLERGNMIELDDQVLLLVGWATPRQSDGSKNVRTPEGAANEIARKGPQNDLVSGLVPSGSPASTEKRGALNPAFSRWIMGFPPEWDDCVATATPSSRKSRRSSSARTKTSIGGSNG